MKAVIHTRYGPPDVLQVQDVPVIEPRTNEVVIRVHAATVNRTDCAMLRAKPFIMRFITGLASPKKRSLGTDFAGVVERIGTNVTRFSPGDRVFGFDDSGVQSHAEYLTIAESRPIGKIPEGVSFADAAASLEGAHYAVNFLNKVTLHAGDRVLINGASGAIGSALLQLCVHAGARVTAVCSTKNLMLMNSLGAEAVIDFTQEDFTRSKEKYDYVFDAVGKSRFSKCDQVLQKNGVYISSELGPSGENLFLSLTTPLRGGKKVIFPFPSNIPESIKRMSQLLSAGAFRPVIDRTYTLDTIREAFTYVESGEKTGNVCLSIFNQS